jgi:hypothetical protein
MTRTMKSPLEEDGRDEPREAGVDTFSILQFVEEASRKGQTVIKELDERALGLGKSPAAVPGTDHSALKVVRSELGKLVNNGVDSEKLGGIPIGVNW